MTKAEIKEFALSLQGKTDKERYEACFELFDSIGEEVKVKEVSDSLEKIIRKMYARAISAAIPLLYERDPDVFILWSVKKENKERAAQGLPPVYAR